MTVQKEKQMKIEDGKLSTSSSQSVANLSYKFLCYH